VEGDDKVLEHFGSDLKYFMDFLLEEKKIALWRRKKGEKRPKRLKNLKIGEGKFGRL